jgi:hypothetical protein
MQSYGESVPRGNRSFYSRDVALWGLALSAGQLHRLIAESFLEKIRRANGNLVRMMKEELRELQELKWVTDDDAKRFDRMIRVFFDSEDPKQIQEAFASCLEEFKHDPNTSLYSIALASIASDSVDKASDRPITVLRAIAGADAVGAMIGGRVGADGQQTMGGSPGTDYSEQGGVIGAIIGAGVASGAAAAQEGGWCD